VWAVQNWSNGRCELFKIGVMEGVGCSELGVVEGVGYSKLE
jgi:hypothetical protein